MAFAIYTDRLHALPGRMRVRVDGMRQHSEMASYVIAVLRQTPGVKSAAANVRTGRALIYFDDARTSYRVLDEVIHAASRKFLTEEEKRQAVIGRSGESARKKAVVGAFLSGGLLAGLLFKRFVLRRPPQAAASPMVGHVAALTTVVAGYPLLRNSLDKAARSRNMDSDWPISLLLIGVAAAQQNIAGLGVLWIVYLTRWLQAAIGEKAERFVQDMAQGQPEQHLYAKQAVRTVYAPPAFAQAYNRFMTPATIGLAGLLYLQGRDMTRSLAVLVAGCPAGILLAVQLAQAMGIARAMQRCYPPAATRQSGVDPCAGAGDLSELEIIRQKTQVIARQNLRLAVGSNLVAIPLAATCLLSPGGIALLQNFTTLLIIANSTRLGGWEYLTGWRQGKDRAMNPVPAMRVLPGSTRMAGHLTPVLAELGPEPVSWCHESGEFLCRQLGTTPEQGLTESQAADRLEHFGENRLAEGEAVPLWRLVLRQFDDVMVQVLLGAAGLSIFLGQRKDAFLTVAVVFGNAVLGVVQEKRAENSLAALQRLTAPAAKVIREGKLLKKPAKLLTPGDIILLEAGDRVAADARLLSCRSFAVEEASLTGEAVPVKKEAQYLAKGIVPLAGQKNMVFMGTSVTRGRAVAIVVATGMTTEMGKIALMLNHAAPEKTPLQMRLEELANYLLKGCLAVSGLVFALGVWRGGGVLPMLQTGASLAVAAIPEGLSAVVMIALAMGVRRMAKRNIIVRKLASLEALGCATVICSDKTGTLTQNAMTIRAVITADAAYRISGEGYRPEGEFYGETGAVNPADDPVLWQTLLTGAVCNNSRLYLESLTDSQQPGQGGTQWRVEGDPTEAAFLVAAAKAGIPFEQLGQSYVRLQENPFEPERRMMSVVCAEKDRVLYCKGAPDAILAKCYGYLTGSGIQPLNESMRERLLAASEYLASRAMRVLAAAYRPLTQECREAEGEGLEQGLVFCGLAGMVDPPRSTVRSAIVRCRQAGIKVIMITGDHPRTALAVAGEIGLPADESTLLTGCDLDQLTDEELHEAVGRVTIFARTAPQHKLRIVQALRAGGHIAAMTGDGVNDAPAVKAAHIGIAMGLQGTDVTKEAAAMTLTDDNFATIVAAVEEGRAIHANIRKAIRYLLATNIGEVVLMVAAMVGGLPVPLLPIQLLFINMVGDGLPALALVNDPPARDIMQKPPHDAHHNVFAGSLGRKILQRGIAIGGISLLYYWWLLRRGTTIEAARTAVMLQLSISQFFHLFDCRIEKEAGRVGILSNPALLASAAASFGLVIAVIQVPALRLLFSAAPLTPGHWVTAAVTGAASAAADGALNPIAERLWPEKQPCLSLPAPSSQATAPQTA
ncbi:HAD-IC family P-type ATPase [Acetonema longum]|uniref:Calcium-translocating P-type atpase, pmca-type n=1 Tax=Acetonema longum DSM 6540 TaxID=1009370 RepID=F7NJV5_9FIRM|nr:HAD-IC family P-type ATPase [Acetonema longum]EGO63687.1 calcium-translocating p-type atpase, pmca-type [Acetonema longum DSM 6540]